MNPVEELLTRAGSYVGEGTNHEGERFSGELRLSAVGSRNGLSLWFRATGVEGAVYHEEHTLIGTRPDGRPALWTLNSNVPFLLEHVLVESSDSSSFRFRFGDPAASDTFREEIILTPHEDGRLTYAFFWGMPGGEFAERSAVTMAPTSNTGRGRHQASQAPPQTPLSSRTFTPRR